MLNRANAIMAALMTAFVIYFLWWSSLGFPHEVTICEPAGTAEKCSAHYPPVGAIRWILFQLDRYGVLITAVFTGFIAWFTLTLRRSTDNMWIETKKTADAAKNSADAALAAERARFYIVIEDTNISDILKSYEFPDSSGPSHRTIEPKIGYRFRNYGKTPGIILEISFGMSLSDEPVDPVYSTVLTSFSENMVAAGDATDSRAFWHTSALTKGEADLIRRNQCRLWFHGRIDYRDVFGNPKVHRFYYRTVNPTRGFCVLQPIDYKHYNQST